MSESKKGPRVIKKYPNRRLYDTVESRYITLNDIRHLVTEKAEFMVIDKKTNEDITRSILLQVIAEQESGDPMMSQDFLSQVIRSYGGAMQNFVGSYLENSLKLFTSQQAQMRESLHEQNSTDPYSAFATFTRKNLEFWRTMQEQFFQSMTGKSMPPRPDSQSDNDEPPKA
jgi:polyhydroxyalkanoate synthesis repressor PhaR